LRCRVRQCPCPLLVMFGGNGNSKVSIMALV
jgi:hypothetical protein